jgi:hypothetical protein
MGRAYAGILGSLACLLTVARGVLGGAAVEGTLLAGSAALALFAIVGYLAGQAAELIVRDSVHTEFQAAMAAWQKQHPTQNQTKPTT